MKNHEVRDGLDALAVADVAAMDRGELEAAVAAAGRVRAWIDGFDLRCARRARELASQGASAGAASTMTNRGRRSGKDAESVAAREEICSSMPSFEDALGFGTVSAGHLDALARTSRRLDEETRAEFIAEEGDLLTAAESERIEAFERRCAEMARRLSARRAESDAAELDHQRARSSVKRWTDKTTGMHHTHLELDPLRDAAIWSVVDAQLAGLRTIDGTARTPWEQLKVDAVVAAVAGRSTGQSGTTAAVVDRIPEATVLIDHATLVSGLHDNSVCELDDGTPIPLSTMRRLLCDCEVLPVVLGAQGEVMEAGRSRRTATRGQRRALRAMHRTCAHPECRVTFAACRIHHVRWWWRHLGPTDLDNLIPLCEQHHHLVHDGGWELSLDADRVATWVRPDGTVAHRGSCIDRAPAGVPPPGCSDEAAGRVHSIRPAGRSATDP